MADGKTKPSAIFYLPFNLAEKIINYYRGNRGR